MGSALIALAAAALGSLTTLVSMLMAQRSAERIRRQDFERADRHRLEDRNHARDSQLLDDRRKTYAILNAAARTARDVLVTCKVELEKTGTIEPETQAALDIAWTAYVAKHAEAHMSVSDEVLDALGSVNGSLRQVHRLTRNLSQSGQDRESILTEIDRRVDELWGRLTSLRDAMRTDLGITSRRQQT
ncbi:MULTISPECIES: hypothetical protein [Streptomyces]|uniref:Secreted protein n=1 Tax=Streptomyces doudnae TaxID=3075536 RepID=A0ABD5F176_9ACTN|nr:MULTISPECIES: hypothetical protein [unclassified Streptomyces]MDT0440359.1 hypothetical protein [Streptomyces sp. DSM 41981]MYQ68575.1 hypothetical protein [Streptomyces sp. SID4950]